MWIRFCNLSKANSIFVCIARVCCGIPLCTFCRIKIDCWRLVNTWRLAMRFRDVRFAAQLVFQFRFQLHNNVVGHESKAFEYIDRTTQRERERNKKEKQETERETGTSLVAYTYTNPHTLARFIWSCLAVINQRYEKNSKLFSYGAIQYTIQYLFNAGPGINVPILCFVLCDVRCR